ncbi:hypothetical protein LCL61_31340 [Amycolatopsis coloradensis]|uniref:Uncharacterized protein n=1 Tax=Amycolatopsis coloradensis TaxID=76021 RepID=A0ACD5BKV2_9PSEU
MDQYGGLGLLFGLAYFAGALVMTGAGLLTIVLWLLPAIPFTAAFVTFVALCCGTTFGQAALFPSSMAVAVSEVSGYGAYAVALCGFVAQSIAGVAATFAALLHENVVWASVATVLSLAAFLLVRVRARE